MKSLDWYKIISTVIGGLVMLFLANWYADYNDREELTKQNKNRLDLLEQRVTSNEKRTDEKLEDISDDTEYIIDVLDDLRSR